MDPVAVHDVAPNGAELAAPAKGSGCLVRSESGCLVRSEIEPMAVTPVSSRRSTTMCVRSTKPSWLVPHCLAERSDRPGHQASGSAAFSAQTTNDFGMPRRGRGSESSRCPRRASQRSRAGTPRSQISLNSPGPEITITHPSSHRGQMPMSVSGGRRPWTTTDGRGPGTLAPAAGSAHPRLPTRDLDRIHPSELRSWRVEHAERCIADASGKRNGP